MPDSRLGPGTLMLDTFAFETQAAAVKLTPDVSSEDGTPTLAVPKPAPNTTITWKLAIDAIQDFEDAAGLVNYLMDNALSEVAFEWIPITETGPTYSGTVQLVPIEVGGDVAVQVVTTVELPLVGDPVRLDGVPAATSSRSSRGKAAAE